MYGPEGIGAGWALWIDAWAAALRSPEMAEVSQRLDVRWKETVAEVIRQGVASGEMTCADPSGAAWRITALIDGLAVQTTVHDGVLAKRQINTWVRAMAAAELGVAPSDLRALTSRISDQPRDRIVRRRPAPAGPARTREMSLVVAPSVARSASIRPNVGANLNA